MCGKKKDGAAKARAKGKKRGRGQSGKEKTCNRVAEWSNLFGEKNWLVKGD